MNFDVKGFFSENKSYIIVIALFTALNTIIVSYRSDNRVDFNTLLSGYERENLSLRSDNKALRLDLMSAKSMISDCYRELEDVNNDLKECLKNN